MNDMSQERIPRITSIEGRQTAVLRFIDTSFNLSLDGNKRPVNFEKEDILGMGDLSAVFLGKMDMDGEERFVAVKLFLPLLKLNQEYGKEAIRKAFENEAKILGRLDHPSIAKF